MLLASLKVNKGCLLIKRAKVTIFLKKYYNINSYKLSTDKIKPLSLYKKSGLSYQKALMILFLLFAHYGSNCIFMFVRGKTNILCVSFVIEHFVKSELISPVHNIFI